MPEARPRILARSSGALRGVAASRRRGVYKALVAVAHTLLVIVYHLLKTHQPSHELGPDYFERLDQAQLQRHPGRRLEQLEQLGYTVTLNSTGTA